FLALALPLLAAGFAHAQIRVYAKVDSQTTIYPGQRFTYSVVVEGGATPSRIDVSPLAPFNPTRAGSGQEMRQIDGRMTVRYSENYAIVAEEVGTMVLPSVAVVVDGKTYTTNPVEVTVSAPGTTDRLALDVVVSERKCYVGQPVVLTVRWIVKAQVKDAAFNVPAFKSGDFYLEDMPDSADAYAKTEVTIHDVPVVVSETRELIKGMEAAVLSFSKILIPKQAGRITLDPVSVSASMATGRVRTNDIFNRYRTTYERFSVQSEPVELEVLPLPEAGKPAGFYGLMGRYTIEALATPTEVSVGDPITLTLRIGGNPYLKPVQWPDLQTVLGEDFKVPTEKASPVVEHGVKVFKQTIRATNDAVTQVPPIPLAYFEPRSGSYAVAATKPIELEVTPAKILTERDVEGTSPGSVGRAVEALREGFSANYYGPEVLINQTFSPVSALARPGYAVVWGLPLMGFVASVAYRLGTRANPDAMARKRRRHACQVAVRQLKALSDEAAGERHDLLAAAMKGYLGDRFGKTAGSLTADDCHSVVLSATDDVELADRFKAKIATFEAARYASLDAQVDAAQIEETMELLRLVEEESKP
ncbi:MAG: BatD family protein, partial [Phycisphaerales bacterium]